MSAVPAAANGPDPICVQGRWAQAGNDLQYVCLSWYFEARLYAPAEMAEFLTQGSQAR